MEQMHRRKTHSTSIRNASHRRNCTSRCFEQSRRWVLPLQQIPIYVLRWPGAHDYGNGRSLGRMYLVFCVFALLVSASVWPVLTNCACAKPIISLLLIAPRQPHLLDDLQWWIVNPARNGSIQALCWLHHNLSSHETRPKNGGKYSWPTYRRDSADLEFVDRRRVVVWS